MPNRVSWVSVSLVSNENLYILPGIPFFRVIIYIYYNIFK